MLNKIKYSIILSSVLLLSGCIEEGTNKTETELFPSSHSANNGYIVTAERGPLLFAEISDNSGQRAIITKADSNEYRFMNEIDYPIKTNSIYSNMNVYGVIDMNRNGMIDSKDIYLEDRLISSKDNLTLLTTILYDNDPYIENLKANWFVKLFNVSLNEENKIDVVDLYQLPSKNRASAYINNAIFHKIKTNNETLSEISERLKQYASGHGDFTNNIEEGYHHLGDYNSTLSTLTNGNIPLDTSNLGFLELVQKDIAEIHLNYLESINDLENIMQVGTNPNNINYILENKIVTDLKNSEQTKNTIKVMNDQNVWEFAAHIKDKIQEYSQIFSYDDFGNIIFPEDYIGIPDNTEDYEISFTDFDISSIDGNYTGSMTTSNLNCQNMELNILLSSGSISGSSSATNSEIIGDASINEETGMIDLNFSDVWQTYNGLSYVTEIGVDENNTMQYESVLNGNWQDIKGECNGVFSLSKNNK